MYLNIIFCAELGIIALCAIVIVIKYMRKPKSAIDNSRSFENTHCDTKKHEVKCSIWTWFALILSFIAFFVSIWIFYSNQFFYECHSDSVIVGIFGILITLLVGWQIYKTVDVDNKISERLNGQDTRIKNEETKLNEVINEINAAFEIQKTHIEEKNEDTCNRFLSLNSYTYALTFFYLPDFNDKYKEYFITVFNSLFASLFYFDRIKVKPDVRFHKDNDINNRIELMLKTIDKVNKLRGNEKLKVNFGDFSEWKFGLDMIKDKNKRNVVQSFMNSIECLPPTY